jgi:hypothetical protein
MNLAIGPAAAASAKRLPNAATATADTPEPMVGETRDNGSTGSKQR